MKMLAIEESPIADFLGEELAVHGWSPRDLAEILGRPLELVDEIVSGKGKISQEMSKILGDAFGVSPELLLSLQRAYR